MNLVDYIAIVLALFCLWGLSTSIPNWQGAVRHKRSLKAQGINGINERLARKEIRLHRNITFGLLYILVLALWVALPTMYVFGATVGGLWLTLGLCATCIGLVRWSRQERDDGESALLEVIRITHERMSALEDKHDDD